MHVSRRRGSVDPADAGATPDACEALRPYRHLAVRVLARAFLDLTDPACATDRESARMFLAGSDLLGHWCRVAALDPGWIVRRAEIVQGIPPRRNHSSFLQTGDPHAESRWDAVHDGVR